MSDSTVYVRVKYSDQQRNPFSAALAVGDCSSVRKFRSLDRMHEHLSQVTNGMFPGCQVDVLFDRQARGELGKDYVNSILSRAALRNGVFACYSGDERDDE